MIKAQLKSYQKESYHRKYANPESGNSKLGKENTNYR